MQQAVFVFTGNVREMPFSILIATQGEMHQLKNAQRKNLVQAMYYKDTLKGSEVNVDINEHKLKSVAVT